MTWHSAVVTDNQDPEQRGRLKLLVAELAAAEWPTWVPAWSPAGLQLLAVPVVGDLVIVHRTPAGGLAWAAGLVQGDRRYPDALRRDYPHRVGLASPDGGAALVACDGNRVLLLSGAGTSAGIDLATTESGLLEHALMGEAFVADWKAVLDALVTLGTSLGSAVSIASVVAAGNALNAAIAAQAANAATSAASGGLPLLSRWVRLEG